jgi:predicted transcriptional regulator
MSDQEVEPELLGLTAKIVAAHLSKNVVPFADLPALIRSVHDALASTVTEPAPEPKPAVPIKKSVTPSHLVCLEDGKRFRTLRRHLTTAHGMSPHDYRARWGLAPDYPMAAPAFAKQRSELSKATGFGQRPLRPAPKSRKRRAKA